jgi:hypothetical protein
MTDSLDLKVKLDVSDIFNQTAAIKQAIQNSVQQGFTSAAGGSALLQNPFSPIQYAQPSFARMADPSIYQRDALIQTILSKTPPPINTPPGLDPTVYNQEYWSNWGERNLTPIVVGAAAFAGGVGAWMGLPKVLSQFGPTVQTPRIWAGLREALGMSIEPIEHTVGKKWFGGWGVGGAAAGWRAAEARGLGAVAKTVGLVGGLAFSMGPQLIASEAVGYGVEKLIQDVQTRSEVRNIGFDIMGPAFSTAFGGRGFTTKQTENITDWMKDQARKSNIKVPTLLGIAEFAAGTGNLGRTSDIEEIKNQIIKTLDTLGRIATETRSSLEEVMGHARDLKNMGYRFGSPAMNKAIAGLPSEMRWSGMSGADVMGMKGMGAQMMVGTGMTRQFGAELMGTNIMNVKQMTEAGVLGGELFSQLGGDPASVALALQKQQMNFLTSRMFTPLLAGVMTTGPDAVNKFVSGQMGLSQAMSGMGKYSSPQEAARFMMNKEKYASLLSPAQLTGMQGMTVEKLVGAAGLEKTPEMMEWASMKLGLTSSPMEAQLWYKNYVNQPIMARNRAVIDSRIEAEKVMERNRGGILGVIRSVSEELFNQPGERPSTLRERYGFRSQWGATKNLFAADFGLVNSAFAVASLAGTAVGAAISVTGAVGEALSSAATGLSRAPGDIWRGVIGEPITMPGDSETSKIFSQRAEAQRIYGGRGPGKGTPVTAGEKAMADSVSATGSVARMLTAGVGVRGELDKILRKDEKALRAEGIALQAKLDMSKNENLDVAFEGGTSSWITSGSKSVLTPEQRKETEAELKINKQKLSVLDMGKVALARNIQLNDTPGITRKQILAYDAVFLSPQNIVRQSSKFEEYAQTLIGSPDVVSQHLGEGLQKILSAKTSEAQKITDLQKLVGDSNMTQMYEDVEKSTYIAGKDMVGEQKMMQEAFKSGIIAAFQSGVVLHTTTDKVKDQPKALDIKASAQEPHNVGIKS